MSSLFTEMMCSLMPTQKPMYTQHVHGSHPTREDRVFRNTTLLVLAQSIHYRETAQRELGQLA